MGRNYYSPETRDRVVRLARMEVAGDERSETRRFAAVAQKFGMTTETVLDGTYIRTLTLRDVGGARIGLPFRCLRCPRTGSTRG